MRRYGLNNSFCKIDFIFYLDVINRNASRQQVHVHSGQQPVFCIRPNDSDIITPSPQVHIFLLKEVTDGNTTTFYKYIARDRYYYHHGCLWMKSLQETDNGNYIMQMKTCFQNVNFTFSMAVIIKSTSEFCLTLQINIAI